MKLKAHRVHLGTVLGYVVETGKLPAPCSAGILACGFWGLSSPQLRAIPSCAQAHLVSCDSLRLKINPPRRVSTPFMVDEIEAAFGHGSSLNQ